MLRQVRAPCSHGKRAAERRGTVMALIPRLNKMSPRHESHMRKFGVESFHIEQSTLANRFFDVLQPSINWLQA
jgi:hypothetical protein